jgi:hypothetical protein
MRILIFILLCLPFSVLVCFQEPYVLGTSALFFLVVTGLGFYSLWSLSRRKHFWMVDSSLFQTLCIGLGYCFLHAVFFQDFLGLLLSLCLGVLLFFFMVHAEEWQGAKTFLKQSTPWICVAIFFCYAVSESFRIPCLDLFGHAHFMGAWLLLFLPLLLGELQSKKTILWGALTLSLCFLLFWSSSLFLRFLTILNVLLAIQKFYFPRKIWIFNGAVGLSVLGIFFSCKEKILDSLAQRFYLWKSNLTTAIPFFGDPPFEAHYQKNLNADLMASPEHFKAGITEWAAWAHNEGLQLLIEYGFPGLVLGVVLLFLVLQHWVQYCRVNDQRMWFYGGLINVSLYSCVSFPLHMPCSGIFSFLFLMGLIFEDKRKWKLVVIDFKKSSNFLFLEAGILTMLCLLILSGRNALALGFFTKGVQKIPLKVSDLEKSVRLGSHSKLYTFALAKAYLDLGRLPEAEYWFTQSCQQVPGTPALYGLAVCKDLQGKQEQAKDLYEKVLRIDPLFSPAKHNLEGLRKRLKAED